MNSIFFSSLKALKAEEDLAFSVSNTLSKGNFMTFKPMKTCSEIESYLKKKVDYKLSDYLETIKEAEKVLGKNLNKVISNRTKKKKIPQTKKQNG